MESQVAARFIKYHRWRLRGTPGFPDLVVKLLADPNTYDGDLEVMAEELAEASLEDTRQLGQAIRDAGAACARRGVDLTDNLLDVLTAAGVWSEAAAVAQAATDRLEDSLWNRPRKLHAKARQAAAELELAAANGQTAQILAVSTKWRELLQEIQRDYEENDAARSSLRVYGSRVQASEALGAIAQRRSTCESLTQAAAGLHQAAVTLSCSDPRI